MATGSSNFKTFRNIAAMVNAGGNFVEENIDPFDEREAKSKKIEAFYYK